jgi:hypothetical protein
MSSNTKNDWLIFMEKQSTAQAVPRAIRPMYAAYGKHDTDETCGHCAHLIATGHTKTFYKCELAKVSHGAGTDFRKKWQACGKFESEGKNE